MVCYGIGMFLLAGKLTRIYNFSKFCFLLPGTFGIIQHLQALIHEKEAIIQRDQARIQRLLADYLRLARLHKL